MPFLSETDRRALLALARRTVDAAVRLEQITANIPQNGIFAEKRGVFVTLHARGRLRGCIGVVEAFESLGEAVVRCAASSALHDPRFSPVRPEDLPELHLEISVLSPLETIRAENIEIGRHGLLITQGAKRGILLPQVASEHKLGREQFLEETCRKAGLPADAWQKPETQILAFTCEVFSEDPRPQGSVPTGA